MYPSLPRPHERREGVGHATSSGDSGGGDGDADDGGMSGSEYGSPGQTGETSESSSAHGTQVATPNLMDGRTSASSYGTGGGKAMKITSGLFEGNLLGGGTRPEVYGTSVYGSGYPKGYTSHDLPFYFFPIVWGAGATAGTTTYPLYLNRTTEFGQPTNSSRPGGPLMQATLRTNASDDVFHFLADNTTVYTLLPILRSNCSAYGHLNANTSSLAPYAYMGANASDPLPVDALQYYRSSSAVLTLEGYNNTVVLSSTPNATAKALPANVDVMTLSCLNDTIGAAVPLVNPPTVKPPLSAGAIVGIVIGSLIGAFLCCYSCGVAWAVVKYTPVLDRIEARQERNRQAHSLDNDVHLPDRAHPTAANPAQPAAQEDNTKEPNARPTAGP
ncbi:unnamed protein product [Peniophora sp. CBMAI 1063]|nr:unnamed protein product [Peniophora sp. CBMAI 1063]